MTIKSKRSYWIAGILALLLVGGIGCAVMSTAMQSKRDRFVIDAEIDANAVVNEYGDTRLHLAAITDYSHKGVCGLEQVEILVSAGADVNAKNNRGWTPLRMVMSTAKPDIEIVQFLISSGADVNTKCEQGITPLHMAVAMEDMKLIELLVSKGADVNAENVYGFTPLHWVVTRFFVHESGTHYPSIEIAKFLVSAGADVHAKNNEGKTPLDTAKENGHTVAVEYLSSIR